MNYQFEILDQSIGYRGFFRMEKYRLRHELFAGGWSSAMTRECLERGHAVAVLLYDPASDQVVLLEQFRIGALEFPGGPWLLEIVAGIIDHPGETTEEVARRETTEEAGCQLLDVIPICHYLVSPGGTSESITLFCGRVDAATITRHICGVASEHEDIRLQVVSRREALDLLHSGRINSAAPIIALQWLELNRATLQERWGSAPA
ncbi:MAG: NUDIX domain-containing protein [Candidatus Competibacteraceae bacterium]|uniref:ADP-ribose pyrophosphatase n=1 Tax=Candidatus Contendobacter odensis Run_B_J11 TaxID=1400861 RepID=A0A7U7GAD9_9GAMM|nr:NUDIX domain-containing protein [Candidatus Contendobacter odensis]MBK8535379.1 NUDIX domain-containing protein [Candidatus Competibacteraceae bacterium]MBK8753821.1 NUDIX domain-containing protein [Candidatus Competibacteraceae bacterium]CDH44825.1 Nucleoside diphosphate pyrophosphatase [Candidatus Contendobacter odensis Run_B_J11]